MGGNHGAVAIRVLLVLGAIVALAPDGPASPPPPAEPVRGITISTHTDGRDWGFDEIVPTLEEIRSVGAAWVAVHPYARIRADGSVLFREFPAGRPPGWLVRPIREAHAQGLKILIKPHLAYWGSPFRWRGEIAFETGEQWERFWEGYRRWILTLAAASREADGFVVGTELDRTLGFDDRWRELIREVRRRTSAPLTYAANWTDYRRVGFWDALDVIGVQGYFPVAEREDPPPEEIRRGWAALMEELAGYAVTQNRNVLFTELGYNRSFAAGVRPWEYRTDGEEASRVQLTCLREALRAIEREPRVVGAFLWKWFPAPRPVGRNFPLATPEVKAVIRETWMP